MSNDTEAATLTEFLLARIAAKEAFARKRQAEWEAAGVGERMFRMSPESPRRMLAECEAKRRIVERCESMRRISEATPELRLSANYIAWFDACKILADAYADHRDYREEWKP